MGQKGPAGSMCGYPVLAAVADSLSPLLMPLPRFALFESSAFASALFESSAFFHAPAFAPAFFESSAFASAFLESSAFASAFLESSAFTAPLFESSAFASALFESSAFASAFFHAPAFTAAFLESSAFASALFHAPAFATAFAPAFATVVAVRPLALTATAPTSGAGLCRILHDLRGAAGRIDRLRLHGHRDDEGRRRDRASSQCFLEHEYHSVDSVTVPGKTGIHGARIDPSNLGSRP
ncbi:hypothetical protein ABZ860_07065 [Microbispora sp. NPDC046973]|uniref:hypothetical protein n=1 Tax=Microbispora sp. NPDC046973 TaxID=3155022 RepID=UPI0033CF81F3